MDVESGPDAEAGIRIVDALGEVRSQIRIRGARKSACKCFPRAGPEVRGSVSVWRNSNLITQASLTREQL